MLKILIRHNGIDTLTDGSDGRRQGSVNIDAPLAGSPAKTLEEAVYNSPSLLGDFNKITILADSDRFTIVPATVAADDETIAAVAAKLWPDSAGETVNADVCGKVAFLTVFGKSLDGFVSRTFPAATLRLRLAALTSYFMSLSAPVNRIKMYARFMPDRRLDVVALSADGPVTANSYVCDSETDAAYYILACIKDCGFDMLDDELILCGDHTLYAPVTDLLRRYVNSVMPLLLPSHDTDIHLEFLI